MTEEAAYAIVNAVEALTQAVRANTVAVLLDPKRMGVEADEVQWALNHALVIEQLSHNHTRGKQVGE